MIWPGLSPLLVPTTLGHMIIGRRWCLLQLNTWLLCMLSRMEVHPCQTQGLSAHIMDCLNLLTNSTSRKSRPCIGLFTLHLPEKGGVERHLEEGDRCRQLCLKLVTVLNRLDGRCLDCQGRKHARCKGCELTLVRMVRT